MPLDAICLTAVREELAEGLIGLKIDKVQQPERDIVILTLRGGNQSPRRLLISAGSGDMRAHITGRRFDNPASPPMFCMLLRKHLTGSRIAGITQPPAERVLELTLDAPDAMGVISGKRLILEFIGRLSNIILTDDSGLIIDCLRRIGGDFSDKRAVLPGLYYRAPAIRDNMSNPFSVSKDEWQALFESARGLPADKWLLESFTALSPLICRELTWRAYGESDIRVDAISDGGSALSREFFALIETAGAHCFEPWIVTDDDNNPREFSYTEILQYEGALKVRREASFSEMLDNYYTRSAQLERIRQRASAVTKTVKTARDRLIRKLTAQKAELYKTADRAGLRECGDIITANLHLMKKGQHILEAQDFFSDEDRTRRIALDPLKTPQQNAAKYYKDYAKAKNAEKFLSEQINLGGNELAYLESVLEETALIESERDLNEIRAELAQTGYIREKKQYKGSPAESAPMRFVSANGLQISAGRNNTQNDKLTLKNAQKSDVWLHTQKIHGSHVIISCGGAPPDSESLYEAAVIAAYYSSARSAGKTAVDYTLVKYVKKLPGGRPGMVTYTDYKTIIVPPDAELIRKLRVNN